ncbi:uncharacterized protein LOC110466490 [Mizuhopecten yessoensis]|uniref:Uncharacterized protein n=1 Tax=Mizuhopecten yessoensis TaxID=6573 RepID=A0A210PPE4_MIZYE|nr:uncharacterized protein LOC110466490 [Mizuhopecten yessoensis]OWF38316.1 hypothetical protein KP79_PYT17241 [Mizuhopecten yessoensis]
MYNMAALSGVLLILLVATGTALECLFCLDANEQLDHCHPITCALHEECFFERTVDVDTFQILHNAGCRDKTLCSYLTTITAGRKRRRELEIKRSGILTTTPVEYRACYNCCNSPGTSGHPCNAFLCNQNSTSANGR